MMDNIQILKKKNFATRDILALLYLNCQYIWAAPSSDLKFLFLLSSPNNNTSTSALG